MKSTLENIPIVDAHERLLEEVFAMTPSGEYAPLIIHSMETGIPRVVYGNVQNHGLIQNLPDECVVEVPCLVDRNGIQPIQIGPANCFRVPSCQLV